MYSTNKVYYTDCREREQYNDQIKLTDVLNSIRSKLFFFKLEKSDLGKCIDIKKLSKRSIFQGLFPLKEFSKNVHTDDRARRNDSHFPSVKSSTIRAPKSSSPLKITEQKLLVHKLSANHVKVTLT